MWNVTGTAQPGVNKIDLVIFEPLPGAYDSWVLLFESIFTCKGCQMQVTSNGGGDPHFRRWGTSSDRPRDTFHGECDLVVLHSPYFHSSGLDLHVRTTMADNNLYSYIESAALRIGQHVLELQNNGVVLFGGSQYGDEHLPLHFGPSNDDKTYTLRLMQHQADEKTGTVIRRKYELNLNDDLKIEFKFYLHFMTYHIMGGDALEDSVGMMGAYPTGDMVSRQGTIMQDFNAFGFEWQANPNDDPVLFHQDRAPQLPYERCRLPPSGAGVARRKLRGNPALSEAAQEACSQQSGHNLQSCVDDVMLTGDLELANEW